MSARVVITGPAGFLGHQVVRTLLPDTRVSHIIASDQSPCRISGPGLTDLTCRLDDTVLLDAEAMKLFGCARSIDFTDGSKAGFEPDADLSALIKAALNYGDTS